MSIRHPIHRHVKANARREKRRVFVDVGLVALFLLAIAMVSLVHMGNMRVKTEARLRDAQMLVERENLLRAIAEASDPSLATSTSMTVNTGVQNESDAPTSDTGNQEGNSGDPLEFENTVDEFEPEIITAPQESFPSSPPTLGVLGFVRFEDVTVTRYQNSQLGFVMELPSGWSEVYARGTEVLFASGYYSGNALFSDVTKRADALWVHVERPCTSTEATSTIFSFATSSNALMREASACIPPFLVTLGYVVPKDTATDYLGKERFLLSVGRTLYPMVNSQAPYLPIR